MVANARKTPAPITGAELRARRIANGYTGSQLAKAIGLKGTAMLYLWETDQRPVSPKSFAKLEEILVLPAKHGRRTTKKPKDEHHTRCFDPNDPFACWSCRKWDPIEDDRLRVLAGTMPFPDLLRTLNAEFEGDRPERTASSLKNRSNILGVSLEYLEGMTMRDLELVVNWNYVSIIKRWIAPGLLPATQVHGKSNTGKRWMIRDEDFESFLRAHPEAYDWQRFAPGPWRMKAEVFSRNSRWRTLDDMLRYMGWSRWKRRDYRWNAVPHVLRYHVAGCTTHNYGLFMFDQERFPEIRAIMEARRDNRANGPRRKLARAA
jgi:transcriptional regulator with XRE-family HTH domain